MTQPDRLATILTEAERNRRADRAASTSANTVSTPAAGGDYTVDESSSGTNAGNVVVLDANGKIPTALLYASALGGGAGGAAASYDHRQNSPATTWVVNHQLGGYPPVVVTDADGVQVYAEVQYPDKNHVVIKFGRARAGVAHLTL